MKVLVLGAGGQLGQELAEYCATQRDDVVALTHHDLDITNRVEVNESLTRLRPDVVVNCAAWTAVDACESDPLRAHAVNAQGPLWVAEATGSIKAHLVHVSTDYVFSGESSTPYVEDDATAPINVYGVSKAAGEVAVLANGHGTTVVRTSWLCGKHGTNIVKTVLGLAAKGDTMRFVDDQWGAPSFAQDLAPLIRSLARERTSGIIHATNDGVLTWFAFVQAILRTAGLDPNLVESITSDELTPPRPARRPRHSVLANTRIGIRGTSLLPPYESSLRSLIDHL
ncbi:MAG: dTDP-4-dehydrorhamnose reductase [Ilumatobacteraceae bacterium]